jgi:hypothetical protein
MIRSVILTRVCQIRPPSRVFLGGGGGGGGEIRSPFTNKTCISYTSSYQLVMGENFSPSHLLRDLQFNCQ